MSHALVIRGGNVVDGTGAEAVTADVAVDGDRIAAVGKVAGKGKREIDAAGLVVSPGFIDLHTHLDAQIGWDPQVTSISWHGVTTALFGTLAVGKRADINVFDIHALEERMPEIVHDFPFGAPRFIQRAAGYKATVCNGAVVLVDDELTGERGGRVLRNAA